MMHTGIPTRSRIRKSKSRNPYEKIPIWYFLYELIQVDKSSKFLEWVNKGSLIFRIIDPHEVAKLWGSLKGSQAMTYASFSRSIRYHYGKQTIERIPGLKFTYQFIHSRKTKKVIPAPCVLHSEDMEPAKIPLHIEDKIDEICEDSFYGCNMDLSSNYVANDNYSVTKGASGFDDGPVFEKLEETTEKWSTGAWQESAESAASQESIYELLLELNGNRFSTRMSDYDPDF